MVKSGWVTRILLVVALAGCCGMSQLNAVPEITSETENGFHDLVFRIAKYEHLPDGSRMFRVHGRHKSQSVGLVVVLGTTWRSVSLGAGLPNSFQGAVELRSLGHESDALLNVMDQLYATNQRPTAMKPVTVFTAITLAGDPRDIGPGILKIKLFFEPADESGYAELYLNIDSGAGKVYLNEKDPDYRTPVIQALRAPSDGG
jgi:hypothetical protein